MGKEGVGRSEPLDVLVDDTQDPRITDTDNQLRDLVFGGRLRLVLHVRLDLRQVPKNPGRLAKHLVGLCLHSADSNT